MPPARAASGLMECMIAPRRSRQSRVWSLMTSSCWTAAGIVHERPPHQVGVELDGGQRRLELVRHRAGDAADLGEALRLGRAALLGDRVGEVGEEERRRAALRRAGTPCSRACARRRASSTCDLVTGLSHAGAARLLEDAGEGGEARLGVGQLVRSRPRTRSTGTSSTRAAAGLNTPTRPRSSTAMAAVCTCSRTVPSSWSMSPSSDTRRSPGPRHAVCPRSGRCERLRSRWRAESGAVAPATRNGTRRYRRQERRLSSSTSVLPRSSVVRPASRTPAP